MQTIGEKKKYMREWYLAHKKENPTRSRKWYHNNLERGRAMVKKSRVKVRMMVLQAYSGEKPECACCGEKTVTFLTIDHINNDGAEKRKTHGAGVGFYYYLKKRGFPTGYQILCFNCNCGRAINKGTCPHKNLE